MEAGVHNKVNRRSAAAALVGGLVGATGCQKQERRVIAVIPKGTAHIFWQTVQAGAKAAGKEFNVDIEWNGPANETEYGRQIQIVDSFVARRVSGIALAAAERKALVQSVQRAKAANIPVTVFDSGVDSEDYMTFLATNNYEGGVMGARHLAKLIGGKGKVAMIMNAPGSFSTMDRERGFEETLAKEFPEVKLVARQYSQSDRSKALSATENILTANTDLQGIFASSEPSSVGASQALKSRQMAGKVRLVTFDFSDGLIEDLEKGVIDGMVVQDPFRMGFDAVRTLVEKLNGKEQPKRIDLSARLVTKADLSNPDVQKLLHPDLSATSK